VKGAGNGCRPHRWESLVRKVLSLWLVALLVVASGTCHAADVSPQSAVGEFLRELIDFEDARDRTMKELSGDPNAQMATAIRSSARFKLELATDIRALSHMKLREPFETLIPSTIQLYRQKIELYDETAKIAAMFLRGEKPGVDYGKYAARMPEITAGLEFIDKTLFKASPMWALLLVDPKPDSQGHLSRLVISASERRDMIARINSGFGSKLDQPDQNYTVSAAWVLRSFLLRDYKASDEP
jgi:hypothetical protein